MKILKELLKSSQLRALLSRAFSLFATFAFSVLIARYLGPEETGQFFVTFTLMFGLSTLGRFGADNFALKHGGSDSLEAHADIKAVIMLATVLSILVSVAYFMFTELFLNDPDTKLTDRIILSSSIIAISIFLSLGSLLRSRGKYSSGIFLELGSVPSFIILGFIPVAYSSNVTLENTYYLFCFSTWITAVLAIFLTFIELRKNKLSKLSPPDLMTIVRYAPDLAFVNITNLLYFGLSWAPIFILAISGNDSLAGMYFVAARLANLVTLIPAIQVSYLGGEFAKLLREKNIQKLNALAGKSTNQAVLFSFVLAISIVLSGPYLIPTVFGASYDSAILPSAILTVGALALAVFGQVAQLLILADLEAKAAFLVFIAAILWVSLSWIPEVNSSVETVSWLVVVINLLIAIGGVRILSKQRGIKSYFQIKLLKK